MTAESTAFNTAASKPEGRAATKRLISGWIPWLAIVLLCAAAYAPVFRNAFVWNDKDYVTQHALQSLHGLFRIWTELGATEQYYPALHTAFWLEHRLWGDAALGYHLINVGWHVLSACLLTLLLRRLSIVGAWFAGCLFAVHPVAVESVAWVSEQKNTLSTVLYLTAALLFLRFSHTRRWLWYTGATLAFGAALLTKTVTATLPASLLVVLWWHEGRLSWRRHILPLLPWLLAGAAMGLFSGWVERHFLGADGQDFAISPIERLLIAGRAFWFYAGKAFWPWPLTFMYPRWAVSGAAWWQYLFPLSMASAGIVAWLVRSRSRTPLAILLLFGAALFPTLGFLNVYAFIFSFVADHWAYLGLLPFAAMTGAAVAQWKTAAARHPQPVMRNLPNVAACFVLVACAALVAKQCPIYRNEETLYRETIARNPQSWLSHLNLGVILASRNESDAALAEYLIALRIHPTSPELQNSLGDLLGKIPGRTDEAEFHLREALRLKPTFPEAHTNLASILSRKPGHVAEALAHAEKAVRLEPTLPIARYNLAVILSDIPERRSDAIAQYQQAVELDPTFVRARNNLGNELLAAGRVNDAIAQFESGIKTNPDVPELHFNLARALASTSDGTDKAIREYRRTLAIDPRHKDTREELCQLLLTAGRPDEARDVAAQGIAFDPKDAAGHALLGRVLEKTGAPTSEVEKELTLAVRLSPNAAALQYQLANFLMSQPGRANDAVEHYEAAIRAVPTFVEAHYNLAVALVLQRTRITEAVQHLQTVIRIRPELRPAQDLLKQLETRR